MQCKICNEIFKSNKDLSIHIRYTHKLVIKDYYDKYLKQHNEGKCLICGIDTKFQNISRGYTKCCLNCRYKNKTTYDRIKQTYLDKYGVDHPWKLEKSIQKSLDTRKNLYGTTVVSKNEIIKNKTKQTRLTKIEQFEKNNNCIQLHKLILQLGEYNWYFGPTHKKFRDSLVYLHNGRYTFVKNEDIPKIVDYINTYSPIRGTSKIEDSLYKNIKNYCNCKVIHKDRQAIYPKELDIYIPELKLAVEFNGTYWHSIEAGNTKDHLIKKSLLCKEKGIRLIHIYEFEDLDTQIQLLKDLINGYDNYPKNDFNKNNFLQIPKPFKIFDRFTIYIAGPLQ